MYYFVLILALYNFLILCFSSFEMDPVLKECDGSQMSTLWTAGGVRHIVPAMPFQLG